jgi:dienelactone hydrolase
MNESLEPNLPATGQSYLVNKFFLLTGSCFGGALFFLVLNDVDLLTCVVLGHCIRVPS